MEKYHEVEINLRLQKLVEEFTGGNASKFAKISGINVQTFHTYIKGKVPNSEALYGICKNFNVNINWLLTGEGPQKATNEERIKNFFLLQVEEWIEEMAIRDHRKKAWFELQFENFFPDFQEWVQKKSAAGQYRRLAETVA